MGRGRCFSSFAGSIHRCHAGCDPGKAMASSRGPDRPPWTGRSGPPACRPSNCVPRSYPMAVPSSASTTTSSARWWPTIWPATASDTSPCSTSIPRPISRNGGMAFAAMSRPRAAPVTFFMAGPRASTRAIGSGTRTWSPTGWRRCPSRSASSPAPTSSASGCSTPAAGPASPCRRRWLWSAWKTTRRSASWRRRGSRASPSTASAWATRPPPCSIG